MRRLRSEWAKMLLKELFVNSILLSTRKKKEKNGEKERFPRDVTDDKSSSFHFLFQSPLSIFAFIFFLYSTSGVSYDSCSIKILSKLLYSIPSMSQREMYFGRDESSAFLSRHIPSVNLTLTLSHSLSPSINSSISDSFLPHTSLEMSSHRHTYSNEMVTPWG